MDPDIAKLVREERLLEAARLATHRGDPHTASILYERACDWRGAAAQALRADEPARALELAVYGGDGATAKAALTRLPADEGGAESLALRLAQRGQHAWAARVLQARGQPAHAARAWERAGDALRAARLFEQDGQPDQASRVLDSALRHQPQAWDVAVTLGELLGRFGQWEAAVRALQRVPAGTAERRHALASLVGALGRLGLTSAAREAALELDGLGGARCSGQISQSPDGRSGRTDRLFGRYDVLRDVASAPSARVLECLDVARGTRVAVKVFAGWGLPGARHDAVVRFEREMRAVKALEHPAVVPVVDYFPDAPAVVTAWMVGGTLEAMRGQRMIPARAAMIATALLSALGDAHRLGILHRNVKPTNVLFDELGGARLSDFGVAHTKDVSTTATAGPLGTLAYTSPEQRAGWPATVRGDIFSVGVILREMITGQRLDDDAAAVEPSRAQQGLGEAHDLVIARLTAVDPLQRPGDAFEARAMITAVGWPATADAPALALRTEPASAVEQRLRADRDGSLVDAWMGRAVENVVLTARGITRARAFAAADHDGLQVVLRLDRKAGTIWLEALGHQTLGRALRPDERAQLAAALGALHTLGGVHGHIDARHVVLSARGAVLRFDDDDGDDHASAEGDDLALTRL